MIDIQKRDGYRGHLTDPSGISTSKRLLGIDFLKSIAIFGVVFIHVRNGNIISEHLSELFRFAVPVFIVFFAYFLEKSLSKATSTEEYFSILKNKFKMLFVPYAFFTVFYFFMLNDISSIHWKSLITGYWSGYGWSGQYFFIILFQLLLFFPLIQKLSSMSKQFILYFYIFSLFFYFLMAYVLWDNKIVSIISDRLFIYWIPYALVGILLSKNLNYFKNITNKYLLLSLLLIPIEFILLNDFQIIHSPYVLPSVLISSMYLSIYVFVNNNAIVEFLSEGLEKNSLYVSKRTLGIFVLNPLVVFVFKTYLLDNFQIANVYIESIVVFLSAIIVFGTSLLLVTLIENTRLKRLVVN